MDADVRKIIQRTDESLWRTYTDQKRKVKPQGKMIFPFRGNNEIRVSEQEARQQFIESLQTSDFFYSVETPTLGRYAFSKSESDNKRSASTDLTLYKLEANEPKSFLNIEFKAHNTSQERKSSSHIDKDIQKLLTENVDGLWFHLLEKVDQKSLALWWETMKGSLQKRLDDLPARIEKLNKKIQESEGPSYEKDELFLLEKIEGKKIHFHCCALAAEKSANATVIVTPSMKLEGFKLTFSS
jgi:hypothetical protein